MQSEFKNFLQDNMSGVNFDILAKFCEDDMSSYFGFYETLKVDFGLRDTKENFSENLTREQRIAFYEAFYVLQEKAPARIKEYIKQFCRAGQS